MAAGQDLILCEDYFANDQYQTVTTVRIFLLS